MEDNNIIELNNEAVADVVETNGSGIGGKILVTALVVAGVTLVTCAIIKHKKKKAALNALPESKPEAIAEGEVEEDDESEDI